MYIINNKCASSSTNHNNTACCSSPADKMHTRWYIKGQVPHSSSTTGHNNLQRAIDVLRTIHRTWRSSQATQAGRASRVTMHIYTWCYFTLGTTCTYVWLFFVSASRALQPRTPDSRLKKILSPQKVQSKRPTNQPINKPKTPKKRDRRLAGLHAFAPVAPSREVRGELNLVDSQPRARFFYERTKNNSVSGLNSCRTRDLSQQVAAHQLLRVAQIKKHKKMYHY